MKTTNHILDRSIFVATWLTIAVVSTGLATLLFAGVKTALGA